MPLPKTLLNAQSLIPFVLLFIAWTLMAPLYVLLGLSVCLSYVLIVLRREVLYQKWLRTSIILGFIFLGIFPLMINRSSSGDLISLWGWGLSWASIRLAVTVGLRAIIVFFALQVLLHYVPIYKLCQTLRTWGVPRMFIELSYRYINILWERAHTVKEAQLLRLGYEGYNAQYRHTALLIAQTFVLAHSEAEEIYDGLRSRQYDLPEPTKLIALGQSSTSPELLLLDRLSFAYNLDKSHAVRDVSFAVSRGERIALLGANGAGKSTLMKLLSGLLQGYQGEIHLLGKLLNDTSESIRRQRRKVALVMQNANLQLFCPSVEDEIAFGLRNSGLIGDELHQAVERIIDCYELDSLRSMPPHLLSEGQKKWVSIAAIMALEPDIILMDEPTACLDCYYTDRVMQVVEDFCRSGRTVILSTHDMNLAYDWANRIIVMAQGEAIYDGGKNELFSNDKLLKYAKLNRPKGYEKEQRKGNAQVNQATSDADYALALYHRVDYLHALIIGGGEGAERKVRTLTQAGVSCTILSPTLSPRLNSMHQDGTIEYVEGLYPRDAIALETYDIIVSATGEPRLDSQVCQNALAKGLLVANLSNPLEGNIQFPAQVNQDGVQVAVHTAYRFPELSRHIRDKYIEYIKSLPHDLLERLYAMKLHGGGNDYNTLKSRIIRQIKDDRFNRD